MDTILHNSCQSSSVVGNEPRLRMDIEHRMAGAIGTCFCEGLIFGWWQKPFREGA